MLFLLDPHHTHTSNRLRTRVSSQQYCNLFVLLYLRPYMSSNILWCRAIFRPLCFMQLHFGDLSDRSFYRLPNLNSFRITRWSWYSRMVIANAESTTIVWLQIYCRKTCIVFIIMSSVRHTKLTVIRNSLARSEFTPYIRIIELLSRFYNIYVLI